MPLPQDKVFIGMTRPPMLAGTHLFAILFNVGFTLYSFQFFDSLWALTAALPIHLVCVAISRYDPHAFRMIWLRSVLASETLGNRWLWKACSRAPYPRRRY